VNDWWLERLVVAQNETRTVLRILLAAPIIVFVLFLVSSYFLSIPLGATLFFFTPEGAAFSKLSTLPTEFFFWACMSSALLVLGYSEKAFTMLSEKVFPVPSPNFLTTTYSLCPS